MDFQKDSGLKVRPAPIFTDAIELCAPIKPNPEMEWKFNDELIIPLTAFDADADVSAFTQGVFFGVEGESLIRARIPVQTTWGISQAIYILDRSKIINITAYSRAGITLHMSQE